MKKLLLLPLIFLLQREAFSQKEASFWYFGNKAGLDFRSGNLVPLNNGAQQIRHSNWNLSTAVACDPQTGDLLFYTDGVNVWDSSHQLMPNGQDLNGRGYGQTILIVPVPGDDKRFYLFTLYTVSYGLAANQLYCHLIDMNLNGGRGDVLASSKNTLLQENLVRKVTAVPHTNGKDYWLLTHELGTNTFKVAAVTANGISNFTSQSIGEVHGIENNPNSLAASIGYLKASPNGTKLASTIDEDVPNPINLFDFNAQTGLISNYKPLWAPGRAYGVSFSPDNTKLYVSITRLYSRELKEQANHVFQYDVSTNDLDAINASATGLIVDNPNTNILTDRNRGGFDSCLQLAPDGRIYSGDNPLAPLERTSNEYLLVIDHPNRKGFDCSINLRYFNFRGAEAAGLPNFIESYFNGIVAAERTDAEDCFLSTITFYPNPTTGKVRFGFEGDCVSNQFFSLRIVNAIGQQVLREQQMTVADELDISSIASGAYMLKLTFPDGQQVIKKVIKVN
ncbi:T9SS type A sorting domain-containing protein [Pontibacter qinzhouensis]|uniref:T9SS type A sorting domain-containing protein n=1 Tax=Pontibacter qinzhouensis TaxID=2603253 RepID=A0A5C8K6P4_9BACT|nr:T9SS type A sorting domain-containing protein [Pontibacter qinzhouensis]TXK47585.1 T9SS type A sorting domain-containing protein [Pontibacter qinzhouensis]